MAGTSPRQSACDTQPCATGVPGKQVPELLIHRAAQDNVVAQANSRLCNRRFTMGAAGADAVEWRLPLMHTPPSWHTQRCRASPALTGVGTGNTIEQKDDVPGRTECSESAGRMLTPCSRASGSTYGPPAISVSLFARQMSLPAFMAATVGCRPAQPAHGSPNTCRC